MLPHNAKYNCRQHAWTAGVRGQLAERLADMQQTFGYVGGTYCQVLAVHSFEGSRRKYDAEVPRLYEPNFERADLKGVGEDLDDILGPAVVPRFIVNHRREVGRLENNRLIAYESFFHVHSKRPFQLVVLLHPEQ